MKSPSDGRSVVEKLPEDGEVLALEDALVAEPVDADVLDLLLDDALPADVALDDVLVAEELDVVEFVFPLLAEEVLFDELSVDCAALEDEADVLEAELDALVEDADVLELEALCDDVGVLGFPSFGSSGCGMNSGTT